MKLHCRSHASDYVSSDKNGDYETMKVLLNCFACYEQSDWLKNIFIISLYIHDIMSLTCHL